MDCTKCFTDYISCGVNSINVTGTLAANALYLWVITHPNGAKYSKVVATNANGHFTINTADLPVGLLNPYAGVFVLQVVANDAYQCNTQIWNDSAYCEAYSCINFTIVNGTSIKNTLGCPCDLL